MSLSLTYNVYDLPTVQISKIANYHGDSLDQMILPHCPPKPQL